MNTAFDWVRVCRAAIGGLALAVSAWPAVAQKYPSKPVTLVNGTQGTGSEAAARAWINCVSSDKLASQPFVLLNKPGANGVVAAQYMRQQPNDGYTLMVGGISNMTIVPYTFKQLPYDPEKEFEGAAMFGVTHLVLVANAQSGIKSVKELVDSAKTSPKGVDIAVPSLAGSGRMLAAATVAHLNIKAELVATPGEAGAVIELPQLGESRRHGERIPTERASLIDRTDRREQVHDIRTTAEGTDRKPAANNLAEAAEIRR